MGVISTTDRIVAELNRTWRSSLGVQAWLRMAVRRFAASTARGVADRLDPKAAPGTGNGQSASWKGAAPAAANGAFPRTPEELKASIEHLKQAILKLDDVHDWETVRAIDDDMYYLWKELEHKMQAHRQSEARFQLREMFRI